MGDYCSPVPIPLERVCEAECKTVSYEESKMKVFYISSVKTVIHKKVFSSRQEMKLHNFFFPHWLIYILFLQESCMGEDQQMTKVQCLPG